MPTNNEAVLNAETEPQQKNQASPETQPVSALSKRAAANRGNARHSTGPRTSRGKAISKRNATVHGLFSKEIFAASELTPEAKDEFRRIETQLRQDCAPIGFLEEALVERMAEALWRLKRGLRFELRETHRAIKIAGGRLPEHTQEPADFDCLFALLREDPELARAAIEKGVQILQNCLEEAVKHGSLDQFWMNELRSVPGGIYTRLYSLVSRGYEGKLRVVIMGPDGKAALQGSAENQAAKVLGEELENLWRWADVCWLVRHAPQLQAVLRRPDLPDKEAVELLLRFETKVERQFYRALDELERRQRRRQGEYVPPSVKAQLSIEQ